ncbi:ninjurin-1-like [Huso huso]|uniref:Ninjurin-1-like n=1 Tax=Huso huso TaxID=61971 RepID=A0ABR0YNF4_HUSHU
MDRENIELNGAAGAGSADHESSSYHRSRRNAPINMNHYANKKSAAESMLDIALLMANASQLKAVVEQGPSFSFYVPIVVLISISLILQVVVGVLLIFIVKYDLNDENRQARLDLLNNIATGLVFIIVVVNIFITAFGNLLVFHFQSAPWYLHSATRDYREMINTTQIHQHSGP